MHGSNLLLIILNLLDLNLGTGSRVGVAGILHFFHKRTAVILELLCVPCTRFLLLLALVSLLLLGFFLREIPFP